MNPEEFERRSKDKLPENKKFLNTVKNRPPKNLDVTFHQLHDEVFEVTDCLSCANCCKTTSPIVKESDVERLSKALKIRPVEVIDRYLVSENDGTYIMNAAPCPFLDEENYCKVYENRPAACREYPHTNRKNMHQILDLTLKNTLVCPAVLEIVEKMRTK